MKLSEITSLKHDYRAAKKRGRNMPHSDISNRQMNAIEWYRSHGYDHVNAPLRGKTSVYPLETPDEMQKYYGFQITPDETREELDNLIASAPRRKKTLRVYRGETDPEYVKTLLRMNVGESRLEKGFISTSLSASYAFYAFNAISSLPVLSMIILPPTFPAAYVSADKNVLLSEHSETEILIKRDSTLTLKEKRIIPNTNKKSEFRDISLLVWDIS